MTNKTDSARAAHWDEAYATKTAEGVSWRQTRPDLSLSLIASTGLPRDAEIIDVGGGASTLVDHLLAAGHKKLTVLDISAEALAQAQHRLGARAASVRWIASDITRSRPDTRYDLWHDRAVLHFLTETKDQLAYALALRASLKLGGWAIIAGFASGGPTKCSGLPIVQHDSESLTSLLGAGFRLTETRRETHVTPWGSEQAFSYHLFRRGTDNDG